MKQTNKKEFSKFLNKFEKLLDYHVNVLGTGVELDPFNNNTEKFLKTSNCRFILYTESGKIYLKMSFFDKNKDYLQKNKKEYLQRNLKDFIFSEAQRYQLFY